MYNIADKMITGCKFDFAIFAILTLQIPIACFDMKFVLLNYPELKWEQTKGKKLCPCPSQNFVITE